MESLVSGVPVAAWPNCADQKMNALTLEQNGTGVIIEGTGDKLAGNVVKAEHIERAIRLVSNEPFKNSAKMWRRKMQEAMSPTGSSQKELMALADALGGSQFTRTGSGSPKS